MITDSTMLAPPRVSRSLAAAAAELAIQPPDRDARIAGIALDSRRVRPGDLYVALPGSNTHGATFARQAAAAGAAALVTDPAGVAIIGGQEFDVGLPTLVVDDPRERLGQLSAWVFEYPATKLKMLAVTGTNGKTTVATLVEAGISACGESVGIIGTTGVRVDGVTVPSARTTPEAPDLQGMLAAMVVRGVGAAVMEVSSHALVLSRVTGILFDEAIFTNLGRDHLDFHADQAEYFAAKARLFRPTSSRQALINIDDVWGRRLLAETNVPVRTYAIDRAGADWTATGVVDDGVGYHYQLTGPGVSHASATNAPGRFNLSNAVAAAAAAIGCGYPAADVARGIAGCPGAPGRMERMDRGFGPCVIVDYAHTPDAIAAVGAVGRQLADRREGRLWIVMGAGGDRDRAKRPDMGRVAAAVADELIITDDNPRTESAAAIRAAIKGGITGQPATVSEVADRAAAIGGAVGTAGSTDVVMVLGKGHETGQEINHVVHPFDDRVAARAALRARER